MAVNVALGSDASVDSFGTCCECGPDFSPIQGQVAPGWFSCGAVVGMSSRVA